MTSPVGLSSGELQVLADLKDRGNHEQVTPDAMIEAYAYPRRIGKRMLAQIVTALVRKGYARRETRGGKRVYCWNGSEPTVPLPAPDYDYDQRRREASEAAFEADEHRFGPQAAELDWLMEVPGTGGDVAVALLQDATVELRVTEGKNRFRLTPSTLASLQQTLDTAAVEASRRARELYPPDVTKLLPAALAAYQEAQATRRVGERGRLKLALAAAHLADPEPTTKAGRDALQDTMILAELVYRHGYHGTESGLRDVLEAVVRAQDTGTRRELTRAAVKLGSEFSPQHATATFIRQRTGMDITEVSQHLRALLDAGVIERVRYGTSPGSQLQAYRLARAAR